VEQTPSIVWFRNDLRLADNPALNAAIERGRPIIPVFIWAPMEEAEWAPGAASRWWLHQSLSKLIEALKQFGVQLVIRVGDSPEILKVLVRESRAGAVFWNRRYEPAMVQRDCQIEQRLRARGCEVRVFDAALLADPGTVRTSSGKPFQVFTAFWKRCLASIDPRPPLPAPRTLSPGGNALKSTPVAALELLPRIKWDSGLTAAWQPGELGAKRALGRFCSAKLGNYLMTRNRPDLIGTSRLSPHLHFGELSVRQIWHSLSRRNEKSGLRKTGWKNSQFVFELGWREFANYLLYHFPTTPGQPLRQEFERFPWRNNKVRLRAWQRGQTGYPMVDAGMRELWTTGWMHNRVRMIVASFLVKHLLIPWQEGARWFWDTLVDADLANNTLGWQWTAGCGADAAPFFRIFNPMHQGEKFDPKGEYVRRWVPELARVPDRWLHCPWTTPPNILAKSGVKLGVTYPCPIVDHAAARHLALAAFEKLKTNRTSTTLA
jgi:deoxyribodipyrimidine photo-lyase